MAASTKQPAFQFYPGDWLKDPELRRCSIAARGLWIDVLCLMHQMPTRGVLRTETGAAWSLDDVACAVQGATIELVNELVAKGVMKQAKRSGALYSKRMVREYRQSRWKARAGAAGGSKRQADPKQPASTTQANGKQKRGSSTSSSTSSSKKTSDVDVDDLKSQATMIAGRIGKPKQPDDYSLLLKSLLLVRSGGVSENDFLQCIESVEANRPNKPYAYFHDSLNARCGGRLNAMLANTKIPKEFSEYVNGRDT